MTERGHACKTNYAFIMQMMKSNNQIGHLDGQIKFLARVFQMALLETGLSQDFAKTILMMKSFRQNDK